MQLPQFISNTGVLHHAPAMPTYTTAITGREASHIVAIKEALDTIADITWGITRSLRGTYVLFFTCECTALELTERLNHAFKGLGVKVRLKRPKSGTLV